MMLHHASHLQKKGLHVHAVISPARLCLPCALNPLSISDPCGARHHRIHVMGLVFFTVIIQASCSPLSAQAAASMITEGRSSALASSLAPPVQPPVLTALTAPRKAPTAETPLDQPFDFESPSSTQPAHHALPSETALALTTMAGMIYVPPAWWSPGSWIMRGSQMTTTAVRGTKWLGVIAAALPLAAYLYRHLQHLPHPPSLDPSLLTAPHPLLTHHRAPQTPTTGHEPLLMAHPGPSPHTTDAPQFSTPASLGRQHPPPKPLPPLHPHPAQSPDEKDGHHASAPHRDRSSLLQLLSSLPDSALTSRLKRSAYFKHYNLDSLQHFHADKIRLFAHKALVPNSLHEKLFYAYFLGLVSPETSWTTTQSHILVSSSQIKVRLLNTFLTGYVHTLDEGTASPLIMDSLKLRPLMDFFLSLNDATVTKRLKDLGLYPHDKPEQEIHQNLIQLRYMLHSALNENRDTLNVHIILSLILKLDNTTPYALASQHGTKTSALTPLLNNARQELLYVLQQKPHAIVPSYHGPSHPRLYLHLPTIDTDLMDLRRRLHSFSLHTLLTKLSKASHNLPSLQALQRFPSLIHYLDTHVLQHNTALWAVFFQDFLDLPVPTAQPTYQTLTGDAINKHRYFLRAALKKTLLQFSTSRTSSPQISLTALQIAYWQLTPREKQDRAQAFYRFQHSSNGSHAAVALKDKDKAKDVHENTTQDGDHTANEESISISYTDMFLKHIIQTPLEEHIFFSHMMGLGPHDLRDIVHIHHRPWSTVQSTVRALTHEFISLVSGGYQTEDEYHLNPWTSHVLSLPDLQSAYLQLSLQEIYDRLLESVLSYPQHLKHPPDIPLQHVQNFLAEHIHSEVTEHVFASLILRIDAATGYHIAWAHHLHPQVIQKTKTALEELLIEQVLP